MKIKVIVEKTNTGFSAYSEKHPVYTVASSLSELMGNIQEALNLFFDDRMVPITQEDILINFDLPQFFNYYKVINAKALSERIGMNTDLLAQYVSGVKKPSQKQAQRIITGVQQLGKELASL